MHPTQGLQKSLCVPKEAHVPCTGPSLAAAVSRTQETLLLQIRSAPPSTVLAQPEDRKIKPCIMFGRFSAVARTRPPPRQDSRVLWGRGEGSSGQAVDSPQRHLHSSFQRSLPKSLSTACRMTTEQQGRLSTRQAAPSPGSRAVAEGLQVLGRKCLLAPSPPLRCFLPPP